MPDWVHLPPLRACGPQQGPSVRRRQKPRRCRGRPLRTGQRCRQRRPPRRRLRGRGCARPRQEIEQQGNI